MWYVKSPWSSAAAVVEKPGSAAVAETKDSQALYQIGDTVECRDRGEAWDKGIVISLSPLKIKPVGWDEGHVWDEVRTIGESEAASQSALASSLSCPSTSVGETAPLKDSSSGREDRTASQGSESPTVKVKSIGSTTPPASPVTEIFQSKLPPYEVWKQGICKEADIVEKEAASLTEEIVELQEPTVAEQTLLEDVGASITSDITLDLGRQRASLATNKSEFSEITEFVDNGPCRNSGVSSTAVRSSTTPETAKDTSLDILAEVEKSAEESSQEIAQTITEVIAQNGETQVAVLEARKPQLHKAKSAKVLNPLECALMLRQDSIAMPQGMLSASQFPLPGRSPGQVVFPPIAQQIRPDMLSCRWTSPAQVLPETRAHSPVPVIAQQSSPRVSGAWEHYLRCVPATTSPRAVSPTSCVPASARWQPQAAIPAGLLPASPPATARWPSGIGQQVSSPNMTEAGLRATSPPIYRFETSAYSPTVTASAGRAISPVPIQPASRMATMTQFGSPYGANARALSPVAVSSPRSIPFSMASSPVATPAVSGAGASRQGRLRKPETTESRRTSALTASKSRLDTTAGDTVRRRTGPSRGRSSASKDNLKYEDVSLAIANANDLLSQLHTEGLNYRLASENGTAAIV